MEQSGSLVLPSIFDTAPLDLGGIHARRGFAYQDQVAAYFYLQMLSERSLLEVSCETYDDILLVWREDDKKFLEFVQVKAEHIDQLWTVARLCKRNKTSGTDDGIGTSILEKSFNRDRYCENSRFRVVTCRQIDSNLKLLNHDLSHESRSLTYTPFRKMKDDIEKYLKDLKSKKGNDLVFWLKNTRWNEIAEDVITQRNEHLLAQVLYGLGMPCDPDIVRCLYNNLRALAKETAEYGRDKWDQKRISREHLLVKLKEWIEPYPEKSKTERLEKKLTDAGLDSICLEVAKEQQRSYLKKRRTPGYFTPEQAEDVELQVLEKLHSLRSSFDSGKFTVNGVQFHDLCLNEIKKLQSSLGVSHNTLNSYLSGCMYEITARCRHRFTRFQA